MRMSMRAILCLMAGCLLVSCDEASETEPAAGGGAAAAPIVKGDFHEQPDDYNATLLLNDAFAAAEKGQVELAEQKLAEVARLKQVSAGIDEQVRDVREKMARWGGATQPATQPAQ